MVRIGRNMRDLWGTAAQLCPQSCAGLTGIVRCRALAVTDYSAVSSAGASSAGAAAASEAAAALSAFS